MTNDDIPHRPHEPQMEDEVKALLLLTLLSLVGCRKGQQDHCLRHGYTRGERAWSGKEWVWYCSRRGPHGDDVVPLASLESKP